MNIGITIKNYRCFPDDQPVTFQLDRGFTALVGSNNAGKSTLLKFFWEFRSLFETLANTNALMGGMGGGRQGFDFPVKDRDSVFSNQNPNGIVIDLDFSNADNTKLPPPVSRFPNRFVIEIDRRHPHWSIRGFAENQPLPTDGLNYTMSSDSILILRRAGKDEADLSAFLAFCKLVTRCLYVPAFRNAINVGTNQAYFDIQVGQAFIAQWRAWQTGEVIATRRAARRLTDTIKDIFGFDRLEVNAANSNETLELFIDGQSYMLPEIGSGIAQFFIVLANAAIKKPAFVLIDEPELNLHPALQCAFLRCLHTFSEEGVVFATHNLGLALALADRTYSVQRVSHGRSEVHRYGETPRLPEFLGELSFAGYRQLGFDRILLVEGVTDLRAIQYFLSFYGKQDKTVLLPLGGNSLINGNRKEELQEVLRICPHVHALIDSEKSNGAATLEPARQAFVATCKSLSPPIPCLVLERRSTENYFTDAAIKAALGANYAALGPYDRAPKSWKTDNWRIAQEMQRADIAGTDLGKFLDSL